MQLKPYKYNNNIGTCWKGLRISFHVVPYFSESFHFWASFITFCNFLKIPSVHTELNQMFVGTCLVLENDLKAGNKFTFMFQVLKMFPSLFL
jgi:hypothetical protein